MDARSLHNAAPIPHAGHITQELQAMQAEQVVSPPKSKRSFVFVALIVAVGVGGFAGGWLARGGKANEVAKVDEKKNVTPATPAATAPKVEPIPGTPALAELPSEWSDTNAYQAISFIYSKTFPSIPGNAISQQEAKTKWQEFAKTFVGKKVKWDATIRFVNGDKTVLLSFPGDEKWRCTISRFINDDPELSQITQTVHHLLKDPASAERIVGGTKACLHGEIYWVGGMDNKFRFGFDGVVLKNAFVTIVE
jgi:hypothetical protein